MAMELAASASRLVVVALASSPAWSTTSACRPCHMSSLSPRLVVIRRLVMKMAASDTTKDVITDTEEQQTQEDDDEDGDGDLDFEERLAKIQRKVKSGSGKKAEKRKARKSGEVYLSPSSSASSSSSSSSSKRSVLLPPSPLQDPVSDGLPVELGFNSYTERINGRLAALGLAAILLVELATGGSFLKYHDGSVIGLQVYFVLAASAVFIKYEKEKKSIWPKN